MDRKRFKKKQDSEAWLEWLSDAPPAPELEVDLVAPEPEAEPEPTPPKILKPLPVKSDDEPTRKPIFGATDDIPTFNRRREEPEEPEIPVIKVAPKPQPLTPIVAPRNASKPEFKLKSKPFKSQPVAAPTPAATPAPAVSIQINLPEFRKPQFQRSKAIWQAARPYLTKSRILKATIPIAVVLLLWGGLAINKHINDSRTAKGSASSSSAGGAVTTKPPFTPVVPGAKPQLANPDGKTASYDSSRKSYSYIDKIAGNQFTVSQQQLPTNGKTAADNVTTVAKSLNATTQLKTGYGIAYLFQSPKYNSQSIVFSVRSQLMFINSSLPLKSQQWIDYINALD